MTVRAPRSGVLLVGIALVLSGMLGIGSADATASSVAGRIKDANCSDFSTQAAAQSYFLSHGGPGSDPDGLDSEGDGVACETLPCPCSYSTGGGGGSAPSTGASASSGGKAVRQPVKVIKVVDGDTVRVRMPSGARPRIELIGIAAPYKTGECGVVESRATLKSLLPTGAKIVITSDPSQPNTLFGRPFRYVDRGGEDIGKAMLKSGWVSLYVHKNKKFQRFKPYKRAAVSARNNLRGQWAHC